jgi:meso-butanediol dehydrogenase/(S,S)-butanediol dehydrogenase/diacetyl reductase
VVSLTQSAARDLAKHDITVTGFAPGVVATEMWEQVDRDLMEIGAAERPGQAMEEFSSEILRAAWHGPRTSPERRRSSPRARATT